VATGSTNQGGAGIFVVDIDPRHGGDITWDMLRNEHLEPIETVTVTTGNKGSHLYFQYPPMDVSSNVERTSWVPVLILNPMGG
jgi:DNA primase